MGIVEVFIALRLAPMNRMVISPFKGSNYHYTPPAFFYLPYGQLSTHVDLVSITCRLSIGQVTKYLNHLVPHIITECLPRCSGEVCIYFFCLFGPL